MHAICGGVLMLRQGQSLTIDDFELITVIGKGSFGKVHMLSCVHTYAYIADTSVR